MDGMTDGVALKSQYHVMFPHFQILASVNACSSILLLCVTGIQSLKQPKIAPQDHYRALDRTLLEIEKKERAGQVWHCTKGALPLFCNGYPTDLHATKTFRDGSSLGILKEPSLKSPSRLHMCVHSRGLRLIPAFSLSRPRVSRLEALFTKQQACPKSSVAPRHSYPCQCCLASFQLEHCGRASIRTNRVEGVNDDGCMFSPGALGTAGGSQPCPQLTHGAAEDPQH